MVWKDSDRNYWMTAEEAKEYGMIDNVLIRKGGKAAASVQNEGQEK